MEVVLLLVAMTGVVLVWGRLKDRVALKASEAAFSRRHRDHGRELVGSCLRGTATASPVVVRNALTTLVETADDPPAGTSDIYVESESPHRIMYAYGNCESTNFRALLTLQTVGDKVVVEQRFTDWTDAGGRSEPVATMQRLRAEISRAVRAADPQATVEIVPRDHQATAPGTS